MKLTVDRSLYSLLDKDMAKVRSFVVDLVEGVNDIYNGQVEVPPTGRRSSVVFQIEKLLVATDEMCLASGSPHKDRLICRENAH